MVRPLIWTAPAMHWPEASFSYQQNYAASGEDGGAPGNDAGDPNLARS